MKWVVTLAVVLGVAACGSDRDTADPSVLRPAEVDGPTTSLALPSAPTDPDGTPQLPLAIPAPGFDGPDAPLAVALLVLDQPTAPPMTAASTASEIIGAEQAETFARSRTFAANGSPHDDGQGPRVSFGVLAAPAGAAPPPADPRARAVDVDGRSMIVTADAETSIVVEATTVDGVPFAIAGLNTQEDQLLELAASVVWTGERFTFASADAPPGWQETGDTLSQLAFIGATSGSSTPVGGARITYGDVEPGGDAVILTTWASTAPDPAVEARYALDGEVERAVDVGGVATTAFTGDGEFFDFVVWPDSNGWIGLSSPSRTVDELLTLVPTVREASPEQAAQIETLADST